MNPLLPEAARQRLVLASRSPRRIDILKSLNLDFEVAPASHHVEPGIGESDPFRRPVESARAKAADVARRLRDAVVIGADTVVIIGDRLLEKPRTDEEAASFLRSLSGVTHTVVTGLAVRRESSGIELYGAERTEVTFRALNEDQISDYVASGEGRDKAGAYAVQGLGAVLVRSIRGCYYNVVGLPVGLLVDLLEKL